MDAYCWVIGVRQTPRINFSNVQKIGQNEEFGVVRWALFGGDLDDAKVAYQNGDYKKAVELYKKACDGGDAGGCLELGFRYENGKGVKQNSQKALELYGKACDMKLDAGCKNYASLKKQLGQ